MKEINVLNVLEALESIELLKSKNGKIGRVLKVPEHEIDIFELNNPNDPEEVRIQIIKYWMRNQQSSWSVIAEVARKLGEENTARILQSKLHA